MTWQYRQSGLSTSTDGANILRDISIAIGGRHKSSRLDWVGFEIGALNVIVYGSCNSWLVLGGAVGGNMTVVDTDLR